MNCYLNDHFVILYALMLSISIRINMCKVQGEIGGGLGGGGGFKG